MATHYETVFQSAVDGRGRTYLDAEAELLAGGSEASTLLTTRANDPGASAQARFIAATLAAALAGAWDPADGPLKALDDYEKFVAPRERRRPRPAVAGGLLMAYPKCAGTLALRLMKQDDWPEWKQLAVLSYLATHLDPAARPALQAFTATTGSAPARAYAAQILAAADQLAAQVRAIASDPGFADKDLSTTLDEIAALTGDAKTAAVDEFVATATQALIARDPELAAAIAELRQRVVDGLVQPIEGAAGGKLGEDAILAAFRRQLLRGG